MNRWVLAWVALVGLSVPAAAQDKEPAGKQVPKHFEKEVKVKVGLDYLLYLPKGYEKGDKEWPLVLFLHGAGEIGTDLEKVKANGPPKLIAAGKDLPFLVVSPQSPRFWWEPQTLNALLDEITANYKVDKDRVYVTGLSMGGMGTWSLAASRPDRFAALVPICGAGNPADARKLKDLPIRIFQGGKDPFVRPETAEAMLKALKDAGAKDVELKVYPEAGHDSWTQTYDDPKVFEWLLRQKRVARGKGGEKDKPEGVGVSSERLRRIDDVVRRHIDEHRIAGAVTLVARRGRVVHFEAYGLRDVEGKRPMAKDTLFRMASSTKPVTGVAVMMLVEEGKVRLSDPVSKFIPEFKELQVAVERDGKVELVPAERPITIRDLLTHTSGLGSGGPGTRKAPPEALRPGGEDTLADYVQRLAKVPLDFQPGSRWSYSGLAGIDTLSRVVEVVSGRPYDEFLRERVFEPLGMKDTSFLHQTDDRNTRLASIYRGIGDKLEKLPPFLRFPKGYFSGAGGLISTAEDYFRFAQMLANGGELDGKRLLSPRAVELLSSNQVGEMFGGQLGRPTGMGFGLTVEVVVDPVRAGTFRSEGSYGWDGAFGTHFWVDPKAHLVAVFLVQSPAGPVVRGTHGDFETAVMQAIVE
ncbi:MAG TPA: serine hydrolase [Gemmataceae bacterium]|nr:serine hydrolase [Gemmataceae bacterium]